MKLVYDNLNLNFTIENTTFSVLNLALERFSKPIPKHCHWTDSFELHYIADGYGIVKINDTVYDVGPHTFYLTGPHIEHEQIPFSPNPMVEYSVYFKFKKRSEKSTFPYLFEDSTFGFRQDAHNIHLLLKQVFVELKSQDVGYLQVISALLQMCLIEVVRRCETVPKNSNTNFETMNLADKKTFVTEKAFLYEYKDLTLAKLAQSLGLSLRQTERFLKNHYDKTFSEKRTEARMSAATLLLKNKDWTLLEICERLGYSSIEYFSSQFKKYYHMTPREYIKKI